MQKKAGISFRLTWARMSATLWHSVSIMFRCGQLGKQKQALEMRIANYVKAIEDKRMSDALLGAGRSGTGKGSRLPADGRSGPEHSGAVHQASHGGAGAGSVGEDWEGVKGTGRGRTKRPSDERRADCGSHRKRDADPGTHSVVCASVFCRLRLPSSVRVMHPIREPLVKLSQ